MESNSEFGQSALIAGLLTGTLGALSYTVQRVRERVGVGRKKPPVSTGPATEPIGNIESPMDMFDTTFKPLMSTISDLDTFIADWVNGSVGLPTSARTYSRLTAFNDFYSIKKSAVPAESWTRLQSTEKSSSLRNRSTSNVGSSFVVDSSWLEEWIMRSPERSAERRKAYVSSLQPVAG